MSYAHQDEVVVDLSAPAEQVFAWLDDQERFGQHMEKPSMMMMGGTMRYELDASKGKAIGSVITMRGRFFGLDLCVDEVVTERSPPSHKAWETTGRPQLMIMGAYRMGFDIAPQAAGSRLRVFIEYNHALGWSGRLLGALFGPIYARWCLRRIAEDAQHAIWVTVAA